MRPCGITDRLLMGPGPSNPYPEVTMALAGPVLGHLDPEFLAILDETNDRLRRVFATSNALTLPVSGTGSAGMEASFVNFVRPGDPVVVGVNGVFGERMCDVADRSAPTSCGWSAEWGEPLDPDRILAAHPAPAVIAVVHAETSTGVRNEVEPLGAGQGRRAPARRHGHLLGGIEVAVDDWGVDIAYSGTQKCLGVPPGLAPLTVSERALERIVERPSSWYLDLNLLARYVNDNLGRGRVYHHTAPVAMVAALHAGLGDPPRGGARRTRGSGTPSAAGCSRTGWSTSAWSCWWRPSTACPQLTTVRIPDGVEEAACAVSSSSPTGLRSAPVPASWPDRSGASAVWATRRADATCSPSWARSKEVLGR